MLNGARTQFASVLVGIGILASSALAAPPVVDPELLRYARQQSVPLSAGGEVVPGAYVPAAAAISHEEGRNHAYIWMTGRVDPDAVRDIGGSVNSVAGDVMTARIPLDSVDRLSRLSGLERVQLAQPVELQADILVPETGVDELWGGPPPSFPPDGITGRNVVVGIVDTGIDPYHADFWTLFGTRIKKIWDQTISTGARPPGFSYGSEYSESDINARLCPSTDTQGHGTHLAGVAAGNGRATGNRQPAYKYPGVAPEADLVVVKLRPLPNGAITDDKVLDGVRYVFERAAALGKPAVVALAVGKLTGPHDGQDPLDLGISALVGPGRIVCAAAGNYGGDARHAEWRPAGGVRSGAMTLTIPSYVPTTTAADIVLVEAWYDANANHSISVLTPFGEQIGPVARGETAEARTSAGIVQVSNGTFTSANGSYRVALQLYRGSLSFPQLASGTWTIAVAAHAEGEHRIDAWITNYILGGTKPRFADGMTERCLVASPATANYVISVGAYSTRRQWTAVNGRTYGFADARVGEIAGFSSAGPRRDGAQVPHVAAPGFSVASSKSSSYYPSTMYIMPDSVHSIGYGTSVAAASVAGTIALHLQTNPSMTLDQAANVRYSSAADANTGGVPNDIWGWGKLRVPQAVADVGDGPRSSVEFSLASRNPAWGSVSFELTLTPEDVEAGAHVGIYDVGGRQIAMIGAAPQAGKQRLTWAGRTFNGVPASAGVYWARLHTGTKGRSRSFVWLR